MPKYQILCLILAGLPPVVPWRIRHPYRIGMNARGWRLISFRRNILGNSSSPDTIEIQSFFHRPRVKVIREYRKKWISKRGVIVQEEEEEEDEEEENLRAYQLSVVEPIIASLEGHEQGIQDKG